ncbi:MAG: MFS transporter [Pseudomonadota bacterium]
MSDQEHARATLRRDLAYGGSHFGKALLWSAAEIFSLYYLTDVLRLDPGVAGSVFLALLLWSAACDLVVGWAIDIAPPTPTRLAMLFRIGAPIAALSFVASFSVPAEGGPALLWVTLTSALFRAGFSVLDVPHNALIGRLAATGGDGELLAGIRLITGAAAMLAVGAGAAPLLTPDSALGERGQFMLASTVAGIVALAAFLGLMPRIPERDCPPVTRPRPLFQIADAAFDRHVLAMFVATAIGFTLSGLFIKSLVYIAKYVLHDPGWTARAVLLLTLGKLAGTPFWMWLSKRISPVAASQAGYAMVTATAGALILLGPDRALLEPAILLLGIALGGVNLLAWALLPVLMGLLRARGTHAVEASLFGLFTAVSKVAVGLSGALLAALLDHYRIAPDIAVSAEQSRQLFAVCAGVLALGSVPSAVLLRVLVPRARRLRLPVRFSRRSAPRPTAGDAPSFQDSAADIRDDRS